MRSVNFLALHQIGDERDGLDGLAQAHLVGQDGVSVLIPVEGQPVEPLQLVVAQLVAVFVIASPTHAELSKPQLRDQFKQAYRDINRGRLASLDQLMTLPLS